MELIAYIPVTETKKLRPAVLEVYGLVTNKLGKSDMEVTECHFGIGHRTEIKDTCKSILRDGETKLVGSKVRWIAGTTSMIVNTKTGKYGLVVYQPAKVEAIPA